MYIEGDGYLGGGESEEPGAQLLYESNRIVAAVEETASLPTLFGPKGGFYKVGYYENKSSPVVSNGCSP